MPNAKQHAILGAAVGLGAWYLYCRLTERPLDLGEFLLAGGAGAAFGLLPDLLEPAVNPHHRGLLHSYACAGLLSYGTKRVSENPTLHRDQKIQWTICSLSYLSHLLADGQTPMGLPLLC
jgi:inner membrane protein